MQIVLARVDEDWRVVRARRTDLGERPVMEQVDKPVTIMWLNDGDAADVEKAKAYAETEGYTVFTYKGERDPLARAKRDVLHQKRSGRYKSLLKRVTENKQFSPREHTTLGRLIHRARADGKITEEEATLLETSLEARSG